MNLAENASNLDTFMMKLTENYSKQFVTANPEEIPNYANYTAPLHSDEDLIDVYKTWENILDNIKEVRYFSRKTNRLEHNVVVFSFNYLSYYYLVKSDGSFCMSLAPYLADELGVYLRLLNHDHVD